MTKRAEKKLLAKGPSKQTIGSSSLELAEQHMRAGRLAEAETLCRQILETSPNQHQAHYLLGIIAYHSGNPTAAVKHLSRAIAINPTAESTAERYHTLMAILASLGRFEEAENAARKVLEIEPRHAEAENNLGNVLKEQGRLQEALEAYQRALAIRPDFAEAHSNLGNVSEAQGRPQDAVQACRRALAIRPNFAEAENNLGNALFAQGKMEEAEGSFRRALRIRPNYSLAMNNLGSVMKDQGRLEEAVQSYRRALEIQPDFSAAHSNLLYIQNFLPDIDLSSLAQSHAQWDRRHAAPLKSTWQPFFNSPDPERKLRLGFVSGNFARHPCGYFSIRGLEALDVENFETVLYSDRDTKDKLTHRFVKAAGTWRDVWGLSDEELTNLIRADQIDILIGLVGHALGSRLLLLARKPAPIQVSWTGYAGSTGLSAIDYLFADRFHIPEELAGRYRERIIRLPDGYVCYDPPYYAPPVARSPCEKNGYVTFGSFNQAAKYTSEVVAVWSEILRRLPDSRLVLKFEGLTEESMRRRFQNLFSAGGLDVSRLELLGISPHDELLTQYERIDIALDPFPFSGGVTTCESLWMGVPVITLPGETFSSRHSLSHLSNVRLTETIAKDLADYVEIAVGLGQNRPHLVKLRAGLRDRMAQSPLCDGKRFAENLQQALRTVWRDWCVNSK